MEQNHMLPRPSVTNSHQDGSTDDKTTLVNGNLVQPKPATQTRPLYSHSPPAYPQINDPSLLKFPDAPTTELPPIQPSSAHNHETDNTLPSLSAVTGQHQPRRIASQTSDTSFSHQPAAVSPWPSLNPLTSYYAQGHAHAADSPARMDVDASSSSAMSAASPDCIYDGRASSVSLDDPDVRLAAEALGDLRADFVSSPPNTHSSLPTSSPPHGAITSTARGQHKPPQAEPLLSLLTTSHPLLATTIEGGISAYNSSKNYSPRFKSGAEYVEGYVGPIANTLGSVGRVTGVEGGVRWFLGGRRQAQQSDLETGGTLSNKRRRVENGSISLVGDRPKTPPGAPAPLTPADQSQEPYVFKYDRRLSQASTIDTLPAYDEKLPAYTETSDGQIAQRHEVAWQSRLFMTTSGLSVAMSEESLRSLKYCLTWLRWANGHIARVIGSLKSTLAQYEQAGQAEGDGATQTMANSMAEAQQQPGTTENTAPPDRNVLAARIASLKGDVLKTLRDVIETVSKYAGGALPENARVLVRRHLTSLPRKWHIAMAHSSQQQNTTGQEAREKNMKDGAQRVLVLAKEGLDMMAQVSGVLDGTISSAEEWCDRLGRKKREDREALLPRTETATPNGDVKMGQVCLSPLYDDANAKS